MFCNQCGKENADNAKFCSGCGYNFPDSVHTAAEATPTEVTPKKSGLPGTALGLSIPVLLWPLGVILRAAGASFGSALTVLGALMIIPAFIVSLIAFIKSLANRNNTETIYKVKTAVVAFCICIIAPIATAIISNATAEMIAYNDAMDDFNSGEYASAYEQFEELGDYKDSKQMMTECQYQNAIDLTLKNNYASAMSKLESLAEQNYKNARAYYVFCDGRSILAYGETSAENSLKSKLKNPASYEKLDSKTIFTVTNRPLSDGEPHYVIDAIYSFTYTATNSFGGTVKDTDGDTYRAALDETYGFSEEEVSDMIKLNSQQFVEQYGSR